MSLILKIFSYIILEKGENEKSKKIWFFITYNVDELFL